MRLAAFRKRLIYYFLYEENDTILAQKLKFRQKLIDKQ